MTAILRTTAPTILLAALLGLIPASALAKKTDVVHMDDGNVLVGEVKKLELGLLRFSLDTASGDLRIKWNRVVRLVSDKQLDITLADGRSHFGSLAESSADGELRIRTAAAERDVAVAEVVFIEPIKDSFWERVEADVAAGLSFTKSTDILQFNVGGSASYRKLEAWTELSLNSLITSRSGEDARTNSDLRLSHLRFFGRRWFYAGGAGASRNDELGIDFRGSLGGGMGRSLLQSNRRVFLLVAFVDANREHTSDGRRTNNLELALRSEFRGFRYDSPKVDTDLSLTVFANLTSWGRHRVSFDGRISLETLKDFYWDVGQVYYRYDSDPSLIADSKDDWGIVTGLRYEF